MNPSGKLLLAAAAGALLVGIPAAILAGRETHRPAQTRGYDIFDDFPGAILSNQVRDVEARLKSLEARHPQMVLISTTDQGVKSVDTPLGSLLVGVSKVEPVLDGYRMTLRIGNPHSAVVNTSTLTVVWGGEHLKEQQIVDSLPAGKWADVVIVLTPATAEQVKGVGISIDNGIISLLAPAAETP